METTARNRTIGGIVIGAIILILLLVLFSCTVNGDPKSSPTKDPTTGESSLPSDPDTLEPEEKPSASESESAEADPDDIVPAANTGVTFIPAGNVPSGSTPTCELDKSACEDTRPPGAGVDICEIRPDLTQCQEPEPGDGGGDEGGDEGGGDDGNDDGNDDCWLGPLFCDDDGDDGDGDGDGDGDDDNTSPNPVMGELKCEVVSTTELHLSWPKATDDKDKDLSYTIKGSPGIERQENVKALGGTFGGLKPGTDYEFEVRATDSDDNDSEWADVECSTKADTQNPTAPEPVKIVHITSTSADLSWKESTDDSGVDHYEINWQSVDGGDGDSAETEGTELHVTDLEPETTYIFNVIAVDIVEKESDTASNEGTTLVEDTEAPGVPANVKVEPVDDNTVRVSWRASTDNQSQASAIKYDVTIGGPLFPARGSVTGETSVTIDYLGLLSGDITASVTATDEAGNTSEAGTGQVEEEELQSPGLRSSTANKDKSDAPADKPGSTEPSDEPSDEPSEEKSPLIPGLDDILPGGEDKSEAPAEEPATEESEAEPKESESPAERPTTEEPAEEETPAAEKETPAEEEDPGLLKRIGDALTTAVAAVF